MRQTEGLVALEDDEGGPVDDERKQLP
jgi:hypothetical protein